MGTYIEMRAEVRRPGGWRMARGPFKNRKPYDEQNYPFFVLLGCVGRLGIGFDSDEGIRACDYKPISTYSPPRLWNRGLPEDVSVSTRRSLERNYAEQISYLTLSELDAFDWEAEGRLRGGINGKERKAMLDANETKPHWVCDGASGGGVRWVDLAEMDTDIDRGVVDRYCYSVVYWSESFRSIAGSFHNETLPALRTLGKPDDVRIVFGFR